MKNTVIIEELEKVIGDITFSKHGVKTTVGHVTLENGFEIIESSSCVDPENYSQTIGEGIIRERIINKVWELEGYALQKSIHANKG